MNHILFLPQVTIPIGLIWMSLAYILTQYNEKKDGTKTEQFPKLLGGLLIVAIIVIAFTLKAPWNLSVILALSGIGIAAWSDWKTHYLWDEITITTMFLCGGSMALGGLGSLAMMGGALCGILTASIYFITLLLGKETGFGDVKVSATIGFALGPGGGIVAYFAAAIVFIIWEIARSMIAGKSLRELQGRPIPFGPSLAIGMACAAAFLPEINSVLSFVVQ